MIEVAISGKSFGPARVLGKIRFRIAAGETVALVGPSGIGKSTLLRIVAGIDRAFEGTVTAPDDIAMVFQEPTLLPWRTAVRNLTLIHPAIGPDAAREMLARVGLAGTDDLFPGQLSLGQRRRLALARAFAGRPRFLIMDEPFVSLDAAVAEEMIALTERLIAETGPATLFVTHARAEADRLADRILTLSGRPARVQASDTGRGGAAPAGRSGRGRS